MSLENPSSREYGKWITALVFVIAVIVLSILYVFLNLLSFYLLSAVAIAALLFVVLMLALPKYRERLVRGLLEYQTKGEEVGGWWYRYWKVAVAIVGVDILLFPVALSLTPQRFLPYVVLSFLAVLFTAGSVNIAGFLRIAGKWGYLLVLLIVVIVIVAILAHHFNVM
jgi:hypothetical protein